MLKNKAKIFTVDPAPVGGMSESYERKRMGYKDVKGFKKSIPTRLFETAWKFESKRPQELKDDGVKYIAGMYGPLSLMICIAASFTVSLLPAHNVLIHPNYWYESMFSIIPFSLFTASLSAVGMKVVLNPFNKSTFKVAIDLFIFTKATEIIVYCSIHVIWTTILGYFEPFPGRPTIAQYLSLIALCARLWHLIPKALRSDPEFKRRCKFYFYRGLYNIFTTMQLVWMTALLEYFYEHFRDVQWTIALIVVIKKAINERISDYLTNKCASPETLSQSKFNARISINIAYSFWMAISLATTSTSATSHVFLGINFFIDMALCYKVIRLDRKSTRSDQATEKKQCLRKEALTELILNEIVEVMAPVAFILSYTIAYHGPNKDILGNVGCEIWNYQKVEDLYSFLVPVVEMALIDSGSIMLAGILLWWFCRINIIREYCVLMNTYWVYFSVSGGAYVIAVSIIYTK